MQFLETFTTFLKKGSDLTNISKINKQCLKRTIKNWYLTNWRSEIKESIKSKLYSSYTSKIEISPYLVHIQNRRYRNCLTKFGLSDHQLEIEIGRHKKKDIIEMIDCATYVMEVTQRTKFIFYSTVQLIKVLEIHSLKL